MVSPPRQPDEKKLPADPLDVGPTVARSGRFRADLRQCGRATLVRATKRWQAPWLPVSIPQAPDLPVAVRSGRSNAVASRNVGGVAPGEQTLGGSCAFHVRRLWSSTARWDEGPAKSSSAPTAARCSRRSTAPHSSVVPDSSNNFPPDFTCCRRSAREDHCLTRSRSSLHPGALCASIATSSRCHPR